MAHDFYLGEVGACRCRVCRLVDWAEAVDAADASLALAGGLFVLLVVVILPLAGWVRLRQLARARLLPERDAAARARAFLVSGELPPGLFRR